MTFQSWLAMGGYAAYVWPAYALALVLLGGAALLSIRDYRRAKRQLDGQMGRQRAPRATEMR